MPKRTDIKKILIIGSGPIVIGQACEFDYSGTQACKVLREEGYEVVLVNSNPATIMTDPEFADRTYIEPITPHMVEKIIAKERPDVLLPTLGGQTGLNTAVALAEAGVLAKYGVELIGAKLTAIKKAEDRNLFKEAMTRIGLDLPRSGFAYTMQEAVEISEQIGYPLIIRPSYTLGGTGGGIAYNIDELRDIVAQGLMLSPISEVLVEESVIGWKEYELEVMRDLADNVVIVCSIENFDAMGVHTGDSITVAPAQTLTDKEYQHLRNASLAIIREIGVETGGSNIQFAVDPKTGRMVVIEMNPRVSRSSALASKATGFPIAKIAAKLAVGYTLDEIPNDITRQTPACFEPTIDYTVVKIPRWAFEKFPETDATLTTKMKSVGEAMAIGRTFKEALQKAIRSLETGRHGLGADGRDEIDEEQLDLKLAVPNEERLFYVKRALERGMGRERVYEITGIDPWFLANIEQIVALEQELGRYHVRGVPPETLREAKRMGFSDLQLAYLTGADEAAVRQVRKEAGIEATFKTVDTCAAEFEAYTPYYYSTYESESEIAETDKKKVMILGSGPNRIGQGIEFDYCCVHASFALKEEGYETIMVNCNPETVSTDYDTSDRLYFEPLTFEDVMNIVEAEKPEGVIVQFGGQTPLKLAVPLERAGVPIMGTAPDSIDLAEDRKRFGAMLKRLGVNQPANGTATSFKEALRVARHVGFPVLVRPSYVLGGRAMEIVYSEDMLERYIAHAVKASPEHPILIDKFLEGAIEVDVDALCDGKDVFIGAIMEHIEEAGIHSGDSACVIPPYTLSGETLETVSEITTKLALELKVKGLLNIQFAVKDDRVYVLEVNPRASRTVPFVSKSIGIPMAKMAARIMAGKTIAQLGLGETPTVEHVSIKEAVLPFGRFPEVDTVLGPEMKSTGEVMGIDARFGEAFAKSQLAANFEMPESGKIFISVSNRDKRNATLVAQRLAGMGFQLVATSGTAAVLRRAGIEVRDVYKVHEGRPNVVDLIKNREVGLVINTPFGRGSRTDGYEIRTVAAAQGIPCITTLSAAQALIQGLDAMRSGELQVKALQDYFDRNAAASEPEIAGEHAIAQSQPAPPPLPETIEQLSMEGTAAKQTGTKKTG
ncbi:MAG: carbamoyl-phosphate synthase large subunit [Actinobacteria bacterium]|nr:MAG: carbamoyl-phosphate synthase large subunit [Actinomycetota bacterium]